MGVKTRKSSFPVYLQGSNRAMVCLAMCESKSLSELSDLHQRACSLALHKPQTNMTFPLLLENQLSEGLSVLKQLKSWRRNNVRSGCEKKSTTRFFCGAVQVRDTLITDFVVWHHFMSYRWHKFLEGCVKAQAQSVICVLLCRKGFMRKPRFALVGWVMLQSSWQLVIFQILDWQDKELTVYLLKEGWNMTCWWNRLPSPLF